MTQLRDYQETAVAQIYAAWDAGARNVLATAPTGAGKTTMFTHIAQDHVGRVVEIAHRQELVSQMSMALARENQRHTIIGPTSVVKFIVQLQREELGGCWYDPAAKIAVAGVNTLVARKETLRNWAQQITLWVQDECFPAGTLVDGRPIEEIQVGDKVMAFGTYSKCFGLRRVDRVFRGPMPETMIRVRTKPHHTVTCTSGHPFYTRRGFVTASALTPFDTVLRYTPMAHQVSAWQKVESISVIQREDSKWPAGDFVYNIEVNGLHTYVAEGVVVHNCHHLLSENQWGTAVEMFPNARGLGVTATACRADGKGLGRHADGVFDELIHGPTMRDLIAAGYLSDFEIYAPPNDLDLTTVDVSAATGDFKAAQLSKAVRRSHLVGNVVETYVERANGELGVTFAVDVENATELAAEYSRAGVPAAVISAKTPDRERWELMRLFRRGELKQLANVDVLGEGVDCPSIAVVSFARPTASYNLMTQQFGRALRICEGKRVAKIFDHVGNIVRHHGPPDIPKAFTLDARPAGRRGARDPDVIPQKVCGNPECCHPYPATCNACPFCGNVYVPDRRDGPQHVDGDLVLLDLETLNAMRAEVARIDEHPEILRARVTHAVGALAGAGAAAKHRRRQEAQESLRGLMKLYGGLQQSRGRSESEARRRFFFRYGVDVLSAQAYSRADAERLSLSLINDIGRGVA